MSELETEIKRLEKFVRDFRDLEKMNGDTLLNINQGLTTTNYYLGEQRSIIHHKHQSMIKELTDGGLSVSRAEVSANVEFPELYRLRRVMADTKDIIKTITQRVATLRDERNNN